MLTFLGSWAWSSAVPLVVVVTPDGVIVYGLLAIVIGLIAWDKYSEPPLDLPYPDAAVGRHAEGESATGPVVPARLREDPADSATDAASREGKRVTRPG